MLKLISNTFPNVYCNVRADLHARVASAEAQDTASSGFGEEDRAILLTMINLRDAPERMPLSANADLPWPWKQESIPAKCPVLDARQMEGLSTSSPVGPSAGSVAADATQAALAAPAGAEKRDDNSLVSAPPAASQPSVDERAAESASGGEKAASDVAKSDARSLARGGDFRLFRVFFQISGTGARDARGIDPLRAPLAMNGFRVMRGVEQAEEIPDKAEVRYYGAEEEARARVLAEMLNRHFAREALKFSVRAIGADYPTMPRTTLEVWLPDPADKAPYARDKALPGPLLKSRPLTLPGSQ